MILQGEAATASKIADNLWMGSAPPIGPSASQYFNDVVLCAMEYQLSGNMFPGVNIIHAPMNDDGSPMTAGERVIAIKTAGKVLSRISRNRNVLVTCYQGRNRSGLVAALALCFGPHKMSPKQAIETIRSARGESAMRNDYFIWFLNQIHR